MLESFILPFKLDLTVSLAMSALFLGWVEIPVTE
jgi:hypothetical protein